MNRKSIIGAISGLILSKLAKQEDNKGLFSLTGFLLGNELDNFVQNQTHEKTLNYFQNMYQQKTTLQQGSNALLERKLEQLSDNQLSLLLENLNQ